MGETIAEILYAPFHIIIEGLYAVGNPTPAEIFIQFLDRWQTLISGVLALVAAFVTVIYLKRQIDIEARRLNEERVRARKGARIRVPHALSPLSVYIDEVFTYWARNDSSKPLPPMPHSSIETLMQVALDVDEETFQSVRELVRWAQIFDARANGFTSRDTKPPINWREVFVHDLLHLKCLVGRLYAYGRDDTESPLSYEEPNREMLEKAVPAMMPTDINPEEEDNLRREIKAGLDAYY